MTFPTDEEWHEVIQNTPLRRSIMLVGRWVITLFSWFGAERYAAKATAIVLYWAINRGI